MGVFSRCRRRSITPYVLALWLVALGASMANACGLGEGFEQAGVAKPASVVHQAPDGDTLPACDKFCVDDIPLLTKLKSVEDSPVGTACLAAPGLHSLPVVAPARTFESVTGHDPPPGIAINTRFVRLAL
jgi:hypothetical protein